MNRDTVERNPFEDMHDVELCNRQAGFHWFEPSTKRFFGSRIGRDLYGGCYFIPSEHAGLRDTTRRYSVRMALPSGNIETVGEFCGHETRAQALSVIRQLCNAGWCWPNTYKP